MEFAGVATQIAPCPDNPSPPPPPPPPPPPFCDPTCHTQLLNGNSFYSESVVRAILGHRVRASATATSNASAPILTANA